MSDPYGMKRDLRRWLWRHPHVVAWRSLLWLYWKRIPPWRLDVMMLGWVNPAPLRGAALRGLRAQIDVNDEDAA